MSSKFDEFEKKKHNCDAEIKQLELEKDRACDFEQKLNVYAFCE